MRSCPSFTEGEIIKIVRVWPVASGQVDLEGRRIPAKQTLFLAAVAKINPKRLVDLDQADVALDLFPELSVEAFQQEILKMYPGKTKQHWGFQYVLQRQRKREYQSEEELIVVVTV